MLLLILVVVFIICVVTHMISYKKNRDVICVLSTTYALIDLAVILILGLSMIFTKPHWDYLEQQKTDMLTKVYAYQDLVSRATPAMIDLLTPDFIALNQEIEKKQNDLNSIFSWYTTEYYWAEIPFVSY